MEEQDDVRKRIWEQFERRTIPSDQISAVVDLIARASTVDEASRLVKIWVYGQPDPDAVYGTIRTPLGTVGNVVDALVNNDLVGNGALPLQLMVDINPLNPTGDISFGPSMVFANGQPSLDAIRDAE